MLVRLVLVLTILGVGYARNIEQEETRILPSAVQSQPVAEAVKPETRRAANPPTTTENINTSRSIQSPTLKHTAHSGMEHQKREAGQENHQAEPQPGCCG